MKKFLLLCCCLLLLASCRKNTTIEVKNDGAEVVLSIPNDATAAELINAQTALTNTLTIKAERERQAFELKQAELRKEERQFYFMFGVFFVVAGIVAVFATACFFVFIYAGGLKRWKKSS